jgi:GAF domain-containing protein
VDEERLARTFVELADTLVADFDLIEFLHRLVERCVQLFALPAAGLLFADAGGELAVMASSSEEAHLLELFQVQSNEGPCLDCYRTGLPVSHPDLAAAARRWPRFAPAAIQAGFAAVQALPMRLRDEVIGALNLFGATPGAVLDPAAMPVAQALVDVATIGVLSERAIQHQETITTQLQTALNTRVIIEQAKGVLAAHLGLDVGAAFTLLRHHARTSQRPLSELARAVVEGALDPREFPAPPRPGAGWR